MKNTEITFPQTARYDLNHSYARTTSDQHIVQGVTDLGQALVGDILFVEQPFIGRKVRQGERLLSIQPMDPHGKVIRLRAAVSGEIVAVNPALEEAPDLPNESPYGEGWIVIIKPENLAELGNLYQADDPAFAAWVEKEIEAAQLYEMRIGRQVTGRPAPVTAPIAADIVAASEAYARVA